MCLFLRKTTWKFNFWKPNIFFKLVLKYTFFPHLSMPDFKPKQKHFHNFGFRYMNSIKFQFQLKSKIPYLVTSVEASLVFTLVVWGPTKDAFITELMSLVYLAMQFFTTYNQRIAIQQYHNLIFVEFFHGALAFVDFLNHGTLGKPLCLSQWKKYFFIMKYLLVPFSIVLCIKRNV